MTAVIDINFKYKMLQKVSFADDHFIIAVVISLENVVIQNVRGDFCGTVFQVEALECTYQHIEFALCGSVYYTLLSQKGSKVT